MPGRGQHLALEVWIVRAIHGCRVEVMYSNRSPDLETIRNQRNVAYDAPRVQARFPGTLRPTGHFLALSIDPFRSMSIGSSR